MGGPAIGGGLLAIMAPGLVVALAGICAGVVAWLVAGLPRTVETDAHCDKRLRRTDLAAGFITIARVPTLAAVAMLSAAGTFVFGALSVLIVAFTLDDLAVGQAAVGVLNGALGAGGIVGGIAAI